jgi:hypothetical protein
MYDPPLNSVTGHNNPLCKQIPSNTKSFLQFLKYAKFQPKHKALLTIFKTLFCFASSPPAKKLEDYHLRLSETLKCMPIYPSNLQTDELPHNERTKCCQVETIRLMWLIIYSLVVTIRTAQWSLYVSPV